MPKLAGKTYHYSVDVLGIKTKKLPELNDDFAKDVSDATTLDELNKKIRENLEHQRDHKQKDLLREKVLERNRQAARLPCPAIAGRAPDGYAPGTGSSLPGATRRRSARGKYRLGVATQAQRRPRQGRCKAELIVDRIATAENIDVNDEEVEHELATSRQP